MATAKSGKPAAKVSPARNIVGVVLLVAFTAVAVMEFSANGGFNGAVGRINKRLKDTEDPNSKNSDLPTREEAEKIIGKSADGPLVKAGNEQKATYTWRGVIRKHVLTAFYTAGSKPSLRRIATGEDAE